MKTTEKIDDRKVRAARLKKVEGKFVPSVTYDTEVKGFGLHVTTKRAFWAITYQPRGINPATGKRWGGGVRHELGDAYQMSLSDARAAARAIKARVALGEDPHRRRMAATAAAVAERAILPKTAADALGIYLKAVEKRHGIAANTRRLQIFYARKAVAKLKAERMPLTAIDESVMRHGIPAPAIIWPDLPARAPVIFRHDKPLFEFVADLPADLGHDAVSAMVLLALDEDRYPADLVAWATNPYRIASWFGATPFLGAESLFAPRLGEVGLNVFPTPLEWLKAERDGVVIVDPAEARWRLVGEQLVVSDGAFGRDLREELRLPEPRIAIEESAA